MIAKIHTSHIIVRSIHSTFYSQLLVNFITKIVDYNVDILNKINHLKLKLNILIRFPRSALDINQNIINIVFLTHYIIYQKSQ